jgi:hypothetical protein
MLRSNSQLSLTNLYSMGLANGAGTGSPGRHVCTSPLSIAKHTKCMSVLSSLA